MGLTIICIPGSIPYGTVTSTVRPFGGVTDIRAPADAQLGMVIMTLLFCAVIGGGGGAWRGGKTPVMSTSDADLDTALDNGAPCLMYSAIMNAISKLCA